MASPLYAGILVSLVALPVFAESSWFAKPGRMIPVGNQSRLSLYCAGKGAPTVLLESGFGGGTAATWRKLQPRLATITRTCSYDRAGYGFSTLGQNLPRDLNRTVADLAILLERSGEKPPYLLAGHSNGGLIIASYANLYLNRVAGLVFFDAAVTLPEDHSLPVGGGEEDPSLQKRLEPIRRCLKRAEAGLVPSKGDECANLDWYAEFPKALAAAEIANLTKPEYWLAYLSEAEQNYTSRWSLQARALLPHRWLHLPVRVFVASASELDDLSAASAFGIKVEDKVALAEARDNRKRGEARQANLCAAASDCLVSRIPSANHLVHNQALPQVVEALRQMVAKFRKSAAPTISAD